MNWIQCVHNDRRSILCMFVYSLRSDANGVHRFYTTAQSAQQHSITLWFRERLAFVCPCVYVDGILGVSFCVPCTFAFVDAIQVIQKSFFFRCKVVNILLFYLGVYVCALKDKVLHRVVCINLTKRQIDSSTQSSCTFEHAVVFRICYKHLRWLCFSSFTFSHRSYPPLVALPRVHSM